jgi:hypothetical protein
MRPIQRNQVWFNISLEVCSAALLIVQPSPGRRPWRRPWRGPLPQDRSWPPGTVPAPSGAPGCWRSRASLGAGTSSPPPSWRGHGSRRRWSFSCTERGMGSCSFAGHTRSVGTGQLCTGGNSGQVRFPRDKVLCKGPHFIKNVPHSKARQSPFLGPVFTPEKNSLAKF